MEQKIDLDSWKAIIMNIRIEYITDEWYERESYFDSMKAAYSWIKLQSPLAEWYLYVDDLLCDMCVNEEVKCQY